MFTEAIEAILADHCQPAVVRAIEGGASPAPLWDALADHGFLELMANEARGGAGLGLDAVYPIFLAFGRHALPVPAAQTIAARALLRDRAPPDGMLTLAAHGRRGSDGSISAEQVAFGMITDGVLLDVDGHLLLLDAARAQRRASAVHGSLAASLHWHKDAATTPIGDHGGEIALFSAAMHSAAMAGAMARIFEMTLSYCNDRVQFGKSIGKFQSVQHQLSVMAEHVACAGMAAELAFASNETVPSLLTVATAKARTSQSVALVTSTAHALHGAIGVTEEFDLQLYSRRLHEWRMADGAEDYWSRIVGEALIAGAAPSTLHFVREVIL